MKAFAGFRMQSLYHIILFKMERKGILFLSIVEHIQRNCGYLVDIEKTKPIKCVK